MLDSVTDFCDRLNRSDMHMRSVLATLEADGKHIYPPTTNRTESMYRTLDHACSVTVIRLTQDARRFATSREPDFALATEAASYAARRAEDLANRLQEAHASKPVIALCFKSVTELENAIEELQAG